MAATPDPHVLNLIRSEYLEMPGLTLRSEQVQRLCGVDGAACQLVLDALVGSGFLITRDGVYTRATGDDAKRSRQARAGLVQAPTLKNSKRAS